MKCTFSDNFQSTWNLHLTDTAECKSRFIQSRKSLGKINLRKIFTFIKSTFV